MMMMGAVRHRRNKLEEHNGYDDDDENDDEESDDKRPHRLKRPPKQQYPKQQRAGMLPHHHCTCFTCFKVSLLLISILYLLLVLHIYRQVSASSLSLEEELDLSAFLLTMEKRRLVRLYLDRKEAAELYQTRMTDQMERARARRIQTRPKQTTESSSSLLLVDPLPTLVEPSSVLLVDDYAQGEERATMEDLCGYFAQNASLAFPYYKRYSLNNQGARVLVTNILSENIGIHLALALNRCGVAVVGMDPLFPNTAQNRLQKTQAWKLLKVHQVLEKPLIISHLGLDPKSSSVVLEATHEMDLVQTFRPTHIVHLQQPHQQWANTSSLYDIRTRTISLEQILASIAAAHPDERPHLVYTRPDSLSTVLCNHYLTQYKVRSTAVRLPSHVFGPWDNEGSTVERILRAALKGHGKDENETMKNETTLDLTYVGDVVDGLIAAMQFPSTELELRPRGTLTTDQFARLVRSLLSNETNVMVDSWQGMVTPAMSVTERYLEWMPRTSIRHGLLRTLAWHLDRIDPYARKGSLHGDSLLQQYGLGTCESNNVACHASFKYVPCVSECSNKGQCEASIFDSMIPVVHDVAGGCDVVVYTQQMKAKATDLSVQMEYMEEGNPLICSIAFVNFESDLVASVVHKVPDAEMVRLGVTPRPEDEGSPNAIHQLKKEKLNGRLLYMGWILVWPNDVPKSLSTSDKSLLKLSPGRFFPPEVGYAVFLEQNFGRSLQASDILFLISEMKRERLPSHLIRQKAPHKVKIRVPEEPPKRAVLLISQWSDQKLSIRQATNWMRRENEGESVRKEPSALKYQREFYERASTAINSSTKRNPLDPLYTFENRFWARTRWVVHDLKAEEGRRVRCDWYQEHLQWGSDVDQLSFAHIMAKRELERRIEFEELDDRTRRSLVDSTEKKRSVTDVFEWHSLNTPKNAGYSQYSEVDVLPYHTVEQALEVPSEAKEDEYLLFVRIISDATLASDRKTWSKKGNGKLT